MNLLHITFKAEVAEKKIRYFNKEITGFVRQGQKEKLDREKKSGSCKKWQPDLARTVVDHRKQNDQSAARRRVKTSPD